MPRKSDLKSVAAAYQSWRASSPKWGEAPSPRLQRQIVGLLQHHTWKEVCEALDVSRYHLNRPASV